MTPAAIIALVRDAIILIALAALIWLLVSFGADRVKVADMKMVQKQLAANAKVQEEWRKGQIDANAKRDGAIDKVAANIAGQRAPVYIVRNTARACPVPDHSGQTGTTPAEARGTDSGSGGDRQPVDVRSAINAFELKYETAIADGQSCLDAWPRNN